MSPLFFNAAQPRAVGFVCGGEDARRLKRGACQPRARERAWGVRVKGLLFAALALGCVADEPPRLKPDHGSLRGETRVSIQGIDTQKDGAVVVTFEADA